MWTWQRHGSPSSSAESSLQAAFFLVPEGPQARSGVLHRPRQGLPVGALPWPLHADALRPFVQCSFFGPRAYQLRGGGLEVHFPNSFE